MQTTERDVATSRVLTHRVDSKCRQLAADSAPQKAPTGRYDKESVLAAYQKYGDLKTVCLETGCPPYIAYKWVKLSGLMKRKDSMRYGTQSSKVGAEAEAEFKRLVPYAMDANRELESNCAAFDFDINGTTVDVKFSRFHADGQWIFRTAHAKPIQPDFFVVFAANQGSTDLSGGYSCFVIPNEILGSVKSVGIKPGGMYWGFMIAPTELASFFSDFLE